MRRAILARCALPFLAVLAGTLLLGGPVSSQETSSGGRDRLQEALGTLLQVPAGRTLLERARVFWKFRSPQELLHVLKWGPASKTDAVLTRHFNPKTGEEYRERQVTIYLREDQAYEDLVLDIAHEIVHATSKPSWDPYDPKLTAGKYIWAAIEGEGGEVDAVVAECQVGIELAIQDGLSSRRCRAYLGESSRDIEKEKVRRDFYRVGKWSSDLLQKLGGEVALFPLLSSDSPKLYSSTGNAPYPVALLREFEEITQIACQNTRRRIETRAPASKPASPDPLVHKNSLEFLARRCN